MRFLNIEPKLIFMKNIIFLFSLILTLAACKSQQQQPQHWEPTHNFTVKRLIILNDKNEILMGKVESNWYTPSLVYDQRQYIRESLDSLSNEYGVEIASPQLRGYFSYKYEYHPYSTLRAYYVAKYSGGDIKVPAEMEEVKWMPIEEAILNTPVHSMKIITEQLLNFPDTIWGGSFMVYREREEHQARLVEPFYPLSN